MTLKLQTEHHFQLLSLKGGCTELSESTLVKMPHCWKSHVTAQMLSVLSVYFGMLYCKQYGHRPDCSHMGERSGSEVEYEIEELQVQNAVPPVRLEPAANQYRIKHSITVPLRSHCTLT